MNRRVRPRAQALQVAVLVLVLTAAAPAAARPALEGGAPEAAGEVDPGVLALLRRSSAARTDLAYRGTQLVSTWDHDGTASAMLDVVHQPGEGLTTWAHGVGEGDPPAGAITVADEPAGTSWVDLPDGADGALSVLLSRYDVTDAGAGEVAGRGARTLELRRGGTIAARLWLDAGTGLVLRRELYDATGRTVQAMSYLDVEVTPTTAPADLTPSLYTGDTLPQYAAEVAAARSAGVAQLRQRGWRFPDDVADLPLSDARTMTAGGAGGSAVLHLTYTDGLSTLSVYQQHGHLDHDALAGYGVERVAGHDITVQPGLVTRAVWDAGDTVLTVVAERPDEQLPAVVAALPPAPAAARGWMSTASRRVLSAARWLTPLR